MYLHSTGYWLLLTYNCKKMDSLISLLKHRYIVVSHLAELLYDKKSNATYERLRSRMTERHRFKEEEYKKLHIIFTEMQLDLETQAKMLERLIKFPNTKNSKAFLEEFPKNIGHQALQLKAILQDIGGQTQKDYYRMYDHLRERRELKDEHLISLAQKINEFASTIKKQLKIAQREAKQYQFSAGRGQHSHILDN